VGARLRSPASFRGERVNQAQSDFLKKVVPAAMASQAATGVPASVQIAQSILESSTGVEAKIKAAGTAWGQSDLAIKANNFFGIKGTHLADPNTYIMEPTPEYENGVKVTIRAPFERYANLADCFVAHAQLLSRAGRYQPAMREKGDPAAFCRELQDCGYSSNRPPLASKPPFYSDVLIQLVNEYDLRQYDTQPITPPAAPAKGKP
jgi:flagellar protein FlgJ